MSKGKIAIILVNYNDSHFLIDVVKRIAAMRPDEFIVVDDESTDNSRKLLRYLGAKVVINYGANGPFYSSIRGCQATDAEYVAFFSADDYPEFGYFDAMKQATKNYPFVDLFTCNGYVEREGEIYYRKLLPFDAYISPDYAVKIHKAGFAKNLNQCGFLMRKALVEKCWEEGGKNTTVNFDGMCAYFAAFDKGFVNLGCYLTVYRSYPNSWGATGCSKRIKKATAIHKKMYSKYPVVYDRAIKSGIWNSKQRWKSLFALWAIMKLPKWARNIFYNWFYSYNYKVEKL